jgi:hypothetical protein
VEKGLANITATPVANHPEGRRSKDKVLLVIINRNQLPAIPMIPLQTTTVLLFTTIFLVHLEYYVIMSPCFPISYLTLNLYLAMSTKIIWINMHGTLAGCWPTKVIESMTVHFSLMECLPIPRNKATSNAMCFC